MASAAMPYIQHNRADRHFVMHVEGHRAELIYRLRPGGLEILHTRVPQAVGGRGIAATLVTAAVEFARERGYKVAAECSYAETWMYRHPEQQDLLV